MGVAMKNSLNDMRNMLMHESDENIVCGSAVLYTYVTGLYRLSVYIHAIHLCMHIVHVERFV